MLDAAVPVAPPVNPPVTDGAAQEYVVPEGTKPFVPFAGVVENATALQTAAVIALTAGVGLIVAVTVKVEPVQAPEVGVTV